jgi:hypothetical protein
VFFSFAYDDFAVSLWVIMGKFLHQIINSLAFVIYFIEFIIALKILKNINASAIMRKFFWYPLVGSIIGLVAILKNVHIISTKISFIFTTCSILFHFSFLSFFLFVVTEKKFFFKTILFFTFFTTIVLLISDVRHGYAASYAFTNSCLFFFSLYYFYILFKGKAYLNIDYKPIFYITCGVFIGSGLIVPSSLMIKYMYLLELPKNSLYFVAAISSFGNIIMNLIFIKALLLCLKQNK